MIIRRFQLPEYKKCTVCICRPKQAHLSDARTCKVSHRTSMKWHTTNCHNSRELMDKSDFASDREPRARLGFRSSMLSCEGDRHDPSASAISGSGVTLNGLKPVDTMTLYRQCNGQWRGAVIIRLCKRLLNALFHLNPDPSCQHLS